MADYHPLIARAVAGLERNTGEERRKLYERARTALVAQLRGVVPALDESEITRERLALEEAIRKVEADSARHARESARPTISRRLDVPRRDDAPPRAATEEPTPSPPGTAPQDSASSAPRPRPPDMPASLRPPNGGRPAPSASEPQGQWRAPPPPGERRPPPHPVNIEPRADHPDFAPPPVAPPPPPPPERHPLADYGSLEPQIQPENLWALPLDNAAQQTESEPPHRRPPSPPEDTDETTGHRLPRRSRAAMLRTALVLLAIAAFAGLAYWQRAPISNVFGELQSMVFSSNTAQRQAAAPARPKITDRLGQPSPQISGAAAQRVVLYEEDPEDPQGKRFTGTVLWRTEVKSVTPGRSPETVLRADIDIPDRKMGVTWTLRRNTDPSLPASHTIEIVFNMPPDTPTGGVYKVPGVLMKQSEQTRGVPLAGVAAEMPPAYFLIGLSSVETDVGRNIQLLKERSWFDIPIVYKNNRRAILAMEKGGPGEQAFSQAFASWKQ